MAPRTCRLGVLLTLGTGACYHVVLPETSDTEALTTTSSTSSSDLPPEEDPTTTGVSTMDETETTSGSTAADESSGGQTSGSAGACGDGVLDVGEECDVGEDNSNLGACTLGCKHAVCGDGTLWEGVEECDFGPGNAKEYGGCALDCTWAARCGDGNLDPGFEECDLGELNGSDGGVDGEAACTAGCRWLGRIVFVTSEAYTGALGGLSGADLKCRNLANVAGLENASSFRAWLSDSDSSPGARFQQIDVAEAPYLRLDGRVIAADFTELVELGPRTGITLTETGEPLFEQYVWTNTTAFGEVFSAADHCSEWTSESPTLKARRGMNAVELEMGPLWDIWRMDRLWTSYASQECHVPRRLYCFEDA